jgi:hypothetical protein
VAQVVIPAEPPGLPSALAKTEYLVTPVFRGSDSATERTLSCQFHWHPHREVAFSEQYFRFAFKAHENAMAVVTRHVGGLLFRHADHVEVVVCAAGSAIAQVLHDSLRVLHCLCQKSIIRGGVVA